MRQLPDVTGYVTKARTAQRNFLQMLRSGSRTMDSWTRKGGLHDRMTSGGPGPRASATQHA